MKVTYLFVVLFAGLIGYFTYYQEAGSESVISSSYNTRLNMLENRIVRGSILGSGGEILAQTVVNEDGSEIRNYPYGNVFAHSIGYSQNGRTGLEAAANYYLLTSNTDALGRVLNELQDRKNVGDNVVTTYDTELQKIIYDALGDYKGACVVLEPSTGKILAMVSKPDYNPNTIVEDWESLTSESNTDSNLLNRATQGLYPPGSTFKLLTTLEYLRENPSTYLDYQYVCSGRYQVTDDYSIGCYDNTQHGPLDLRLSLANSCNGSFANIGLSLNLKKFHQLCESFLFNCELPGTYSCQESSFVLDEGAGRSETAQTSMGQGRTMISPMHNALIAATIANDGKLMNPYAIDKVVSQEGKTVKEFLPETYGELMTKEEAAILTDMMVAVVNEGTSPRLQSDRYQVAGKTGSAEIGAGKDTHAWFIGFAPAEDPQIVVSVVLEQAGSGGAVATKVAKSIFEEYFNR